MPSCWWGGLATIGTGEFSASCGSTDTTSRYLGHGSVTIWGCITAARCIAGIPASSRCCPTPATSRRMPTLGPHGQPIPGHGHGLGRESPPSRRVAGGHRRWWSPTRVTLPPHVDERPAWPDGHRRTTSYYLGTAHPRGSTRGSTIRHMSTTTASRGLSRAVDSSCDATTPTSASMASRTSSTSIPMPSTPSMRVTRGWTPASHPARRPRAFRGPRRDLVGARCR